jgi:fructose-bisphosphate aldolase class II
MERIAEIHRRLPNTHLVMHGSSSVPKELIDIINEYGGSIPETYGVPLEEIQRGIQNGVRKVNIDTDNRLAITAAVRRALAENPKEFDPRHFLKPSIKEMQKVCAERYIAFGCAGHGTKVPVVTLDEMAAKYASGALAAQVKKTVAV